MTWPTTALPALVNGGVLCLVAALALACASTDGDGEGGDGFDNQDDRSGLRDSNRSADEPNAPSEDDGLVSDPGSDAPTLPGDDSASVPGDDEPTLPDDDEPTRPGDDEPTRPGDDEPGPAAAGALGEPCSSELDCEVGSLVDNRCFEDDQGWSGGYCTAYGCFADADCGASAFCSRSDAPDDIGLCLQTCTTTCRAGYECLTVQEGLSLCVPFLPDPFADPPNLGEPCTINDQCAIGSDDFLAPIPVCIPPQWPEGGEGLPDGYCTAVDCAGDDCGFDGACVVFPEDPADPTDSDLYLCLETCPTPGGRSTCRAGYTCEELEDGSGVCWAE